MPKFIYRIFPFFICFKKDYKILMLVIRHLIKYDANDSIINMRESYDQAKKMVETLPTFMTKRMELFSHKVINKHYQKLDDIFNKHYSAYMVDYNKTHNRDLKADMEICLKLFKETGPVKRFLPYSNFIASSLEVMRIVSDKTKITIIK